MFLDILTTVKENVDIEDYKSNIIDLTISTCCTNIVKRSTLETTEATGSHARNNSSVELEFQDEVRRRTYTNDTTGSDDVFL